MLFEKNGELRRKSMELLAELAHMRRRIIGSGDEQSLTSIGIVYTREQLQSIVQVQRIEGRLFESKEQAEEHGVELGQALDR